MADSSMDTTANEIVSDQLASTETTMEEIASLTKARVDTDKQIVNTWAASAPGDD